MLLCSGADPDEHVLGAAGPVLHAGAGWSAALQCHGLHEPAHHRPLPRQQARQEEGGRHTQPQEDVRGGTVNGHNGRNCSFLWHFFRWSFFPILALALKMFVHCTMYTLSFYTIRIQCSKNPQVTQFRNSLFLWLCLISSTLCSSVSFPLVSIPLSLSPILNSLFLCLLSFSLYSFVSVSYPQLSLIYPVSFP